MRSTSMSEKWCFIYIKQEKERLHEIVIKINIIFNQLIINWIKPPTQHSNHHQDVCTFLGDGGSQLVYLHSCHNQPPPNGE